MKQYLAHFNRSEVGYLKLPALGPRFHRSIFSMSSLKKYFAKSRVYRHPGCNDIGRWYSTLRAWTRRGTCIRGIIPGHIPEMHSCPVDFCVHMGDSWWWVGGCKDARKGVRAVVTKSLVPGILVKKPDKLVGKSKGADTAMTGHDDDGADKAEGSLYVYVLSSDGALVSLSLDGRFDDPGDAECWPARE